uniref:Uncharacterized protein n=1 Tax=Anguilla anguilla TaxID=7936 RepID=A0A0E9XMG3_ANGAN
MERVSVNVKAHVHVGLNVLLWAVIVSHCSCVTERSLLFCKLDA